MKKAFTLTEVLLSMTIIGIVAVLTVPVVARNFAKKSMVTGLQRTYTALTDAVTLMMQEERSRLISGTTLYGLDVKTTAGTFMKKYLKLTKDCGLEMSECFASAYKNLDGDEIRFYWPLYYCGILSTGAAVCIVSSYQKYKGQVLIDVNGKDKPNVAGRDLFVLDLRLDGSLIDSSTVIDKSSEELKEIEADCKSNEYGVGCFNRLVKADWKMDY